MDEAGEFAGEVLIVSAAELDRTASVSSLRHLARWVWTWQH